MRSLCFSAFLIVATQAAEDWPRWRGPAGDGGWNPAALPGDIAKHEPERLWKVAVGGGYSGITVSGGRAYLMDRPKAAKVERILCYAADSGELLWKHEWSADYGSMEYANGPRASVTIHEGRAYTLGAVGTAACLDAATGKLIWQIDTVAEFDAKVPQWGFAASPVIDGGRVLLHVGARPNGSVLALDRLTGKQIWRGGADPAGYCTPEIITHVGVRQLIAWGPEHVQSLNPETGATNWTYPYEITYGVSIAQPIYRDGVLLVSGYWHGTKALKLGSSPTEVSLLWENEKEMCGLMSGPLFKDGHVYLLDKNRGLQCIELATGKILWSDDNTLSPKERNPHMSLVWLNEGQNLAALLNSDGELVYARITPDGREELARHQVIGKTWAHPAFVKNQLFARSDTELAAWRLWP
ncbi:MAG TPA: PQQ-binding-like beta-propeller repeat protein [Prosthecobacter sp.]|nr:PQQ-binding-like beta-propeller repeat protein [Prosthecobacter sp.]